MTNFTVDFQGTPPADLKVGDELLITGKVTVRRIGADLIDVSSVTEKSYLPGDILVELYSNRLEVTRP